MIRVELSVCQDLYLELAFTPKMTLLRSETGTLKFVSTAEESLNSLHSIKRTNSDKEEYENPYRIDQEVSSLPTSLLKSREIETDDKIEYSPNFHSIENCSIKTSKYLGKLSEMMNRRFSTEKSESIQSMTSTKVHRCEICKKAFKSYSGESKHAFKCKKALEDLLNNIKPLESILLKPATEVGPTDPSDNTSFSHLKNDSLHCDKQDDEDSWALTTRTAAGTIDDPAYFFVKKFVLPKDLFNPLQTDRRNHYKQEESKNSFKVNKNVSSVPPSFLKTKGKEYVTSINDLPKNSSTKTFCPQSLKGKIFISSTEETNECLDNESPDISSHTSSVNVGFTNISKPYFLHCTVNKNETEQLNHTCENCKISYKTSKGLDQHRLKCTKPLLIDQPKPTENHICKICEISFKTPLGLYKHGLKCSKLFPMKPIFKPTKSLVCKICKISFKTGLLLRKHGLKCPLPIKISNKNYICKKCNKSFKSYSSMYRHRLKCEIPKRAVGKKIKTLKTDLLRELPGLYSPIEIGQVICPSENLSTSLMNDDSLNCRSQDNKTGWRIATMAAAGTMEEPVTCMKRNLLPPQKGQSSSLDSSRRTKSEKEKFKKISPLPPSFLKTKGIKFISIIKNSTNTN